eukprot:COSAG06_NODE_70388_length_192_cov_31.645161_1_plen_63_part_11
MQTKVLFGPPGSLLWRCLFSWQRNAAGGSAETGKVVFGVFSTITLYAPVCLTLTMTWMLRCVV